MTFISETRIDWLNPLTTTGTRFPWFTCTTTDTKEDDDEDKEEVTRRVT